MFKIGDRVQTSAVFHQRFYKESPEPMEGTVVHIYESALYDDSALPYRVHVDQRGTTSSFALDELDLL